MALAAARRGLLEQSPGVVARGISLGRGNAQPHLGLQHGAEQSIRGYRHRTLRQRAQRVARENDGELPTAPGGQAGAGCLRIGRGKHLGGCAFAQCVPAAGPMQQRSAPPSGPCGPRWSRCDLGERIAQAAAAYLHRVDLPQRQAFAGVAACCVAQPDSTITPSISEDDAPYVQTGCRHGLIFPRWGRTAVRHQSCSWRSQPDRWATSIQSDKLLRVLRLHMRRAWRGSPPSHRTG